MAFRGLQNNEWLDGAKDVRQELINGQMIVSMVQAINRVRCRRVVDGLGNCAPTDVFIVLPPGNTGDVLLSGLKEEMPGIVIKPWDFDLTGGKAKPVRSRRYEEPLIAFMRNRRSGETPASLIKKEIGISPRTWSRLVIDLKNDTSDLSQRLSEIDVSFMQTGSGRGSRTILVKA